jgi:hypothetical protein
VAAVTGGAYERGSSKMSPKHVETLEARAKLAPGTRPADVHDFEQRTRIARVLCTGDDFEHRTRIARVHGRERTGHALPASYVLRGECRDVIR